MLIQTVYTLTKHEQNLAEAALGGLEFLPQDWYRDENPDKANLDYSDLPEPIKHTTEDIRWLLQPSGSHITPERLSRIFVSLATMRGIIEQQSDPGWWSSRGAPAMLAESRQAQLARIDHLISELAKLTDNDPEEDEDD